MRVEVYRYSSSKESTLGVMFLVNDNNYKEFLCYTLEDQKQTVKVYGETRIPEGQYFLKLRTEGGFHNRYKEKFSEFHKGMLQLSNVRGNGMVFTNVLIHVGNTDDDSAGCLLVGNSTSENLTKDGFIGQSTTAYKRVYKKIYNALKTQKQLIIKIVNFEDKTV